MMTAGVVLRKAAIVQADGADRKTLALLNGRVVGGPVFDAWVQDLEDHLVFPGLVNAHDHLHLNAIPRLPDGPRFTNSYQWIEAWKAYMAEPAVAVACKVSKTMRYWQGGLKNLLAGATTVAHHDPYDAVFDDPNFPVRVLRRYGWAHSLGLGSPSRPLAEPQYGPSVRTSFEATGPNEPWIIHLAEGIDSVAAGELARLDRLGCLEANTVLVHALGISPRDLKAVIDRYAGVVWCPASNLGMFGRTLDPRPLAMAQRIALATDSRISGSFDILGELRAAAECCDLPPAELLRLVTDTPRRMLRMPDVGGLAVGQAADLVIVRDQGGDPRDMLRHVRRAEIRAVVRGGLPAVADTDFADWFDAFGIDTTPVLLDGHPKLIATNLLGPAGAAELEPNLKPRELRGV